MSLLSNLRKAREERFATAIPATPATQPKGEEATVARIAAVAVANPDDGKAGDALISRGWLLHFEDRESPEDYCQPDATRSRVLECHPHTSAAEPIRERVRRTPTDAEAAELRLLVQAVGRAERWVSEEIEQAVDVALADPDGALVCYRALAVEHGLVLLLEDDRRTCNQCANLRGQVCGVAYPGGVVSAIRGYQPVRDVLHRCGGYMSIADEQDFSPPSRDSIYFNHGKEKNELP